MNKFSKLLGLFVVLTVVLLSQLKAQNVFTDYTKAKGGTIIPLGGGAQTIFGANVDDVTSGAFPIGFNFSFACNTYSNVWVSSNGIVYFTGAGSQNCCSGNVPFTGLYPCLCPFWDDLYTGSNGYNKIETQGTAPNRVCIIEWFTGPCCSGTATDRIQAQLFEGTNNIVYAYEGSFTVYGGNAGIGVIGNTGFNQYIACNPGDVFSTSASNTWGLGPSPSNYLFTPPSPIISGNVPSALSPTLLSDGSDEFLGNVPALGSPLLTNTTFSTTSGATPGPFTVRNAGSSTLTYTFSIVRDATIASGEYQFNAGCNSSTGTTALSGVFNTSHPTFGTFEPSSQLRVTVNPGATYTPCIIFNPTCGGTRNATISVSDGCALRNYKLRAVAADRINISDPGLDPGKVALPISCGVSLMDGRIFPTYQVPMGTTGTFRPLNFTNTNLSAATNVTVQIVGAGGSLYGVSTSGLPGGPFSIGAFNVVVPAAGTWTPYINFTPANIGCNADAKLRLTYDCKTCEFDLRGFGAGKAVDVIVENKLANTLNYSVFNTSPTLCSTELIYLPITIINKGNLPVSVSTVKIYQLDVRSGQGVPPYQILNPLTSMSDYGLFTNVPIIGQPISSNLNLSIPTGQPGGVYNTNATTLQCTTTQTVYLAFQPQTFGQRFGRLFIQTDATNFSNPNEFGVMTLGMFILDLNGKGAGALLSDKTGSRIPDVIFPDTRLGNESKKWLKIYNSGDKCDLIVDRIEMPVGDVDDVKEFTLLTTFPKNKIIRALQNDSIQILFTPKTSGYRYVDIFFRSNDARPVNQATDEKGVIKVRASGKGIGASVILQTTDFGELIDGDESLKNKERLIKYYNNELSVRSVTDINISGTNAVDFELLDKPLLPKQVLPGDNLGVKVLFKPSSGPGMKTAQLNMLLSTGDSIIIPLSGEVGTRTISLVAESNPLSFGAVGVNQVSRRTVMITNTGNKLLTVSSVSIEGVDKTSYTLGTMSRMRLDGGMSIPLEISFKPGTTGAKSGKLVVLSNGTNVIQEIALQGLSATTIKRGSSKIK
ncbi:MAG: choice-of-anchor D domain-containing protein [Chlorobiota bacterium]|nr:choice-of-anchor D domain-containing protein [Chlorobiota bacterium]QQS66551.1 MAG: choice-of-anchor D domain-containing protein [Chlorobiota bacterium]